jgi:erythromycin esterase-like protein
MPHSPNLDLLRKAAHRITNSNSSLDSLIHLAGDASFVFLGEASHGTHDFCAARAEITKWLIVEKGFQAIAVEADWPDADRVNRFVRALVMTQRHRAPFPDSLAFRYGCGEIETSKTSSHGYANTTIHGRHTLHRLAFMGSTSTV